MNGPAYEALVERLAGELLVNPHLQSCRLDSGARHRIVGVSGFRHQIDVSLRDEAALYLIEAKHWKKPVSVEAVLALGSRLRDIAQASSLQEYALQFGPQLFVGVTDDVNLGATVVAEHLRRCSRCGALVALENGALGHHACAANTRAADVGDPAGP